jgi:hypothetical protein
MTPMNTTRFFTGSFSFGCPFLGTGSDLTEFFYESFGALYIYAKFKKKSKILIFFGILFWRERHAEPKVEAQIHSDYTLFTGLFIIFCLST